MDSKDIKILLALQEDPLAHVSTIAKLIGLSNSNTAERVKRLINEEVAFKGVHADLNLQALGLELHDFFFHVDSHQALKILEEKLCYYHPYVLYRGRCHGKFSGLFLQFRVPKGTLNHLINLSQALREHKIIREFEYLKRIPSEKGVSIKSALNYWDFEKKSWRFDWKNWKEGFETISTEQQIQDRKRSKVILPELKLLDIKLLAELTVNARRKNIEIMKSIGINTHESGSAQKISRRLMFLKKNAISDYRIFLNWEKFDLYQTILIHGRCDIITARKFRNYLYFENEKSLNRFPFETILFLTVDGFLWYIRAPPSHLSEITDFIWEICPDHDMFWIDYKFSEYYGLWSEIFDPLLNRWKSDQKFMVDDVLKRMPLL
ncbi:MAG: AsnC family transcriptional regulator [Candidatus Hodarchaeales archaeon]